MIKMEIKKGHTLSQFVDIVTENNGDIEDYYQNKEVVRIAKFRAVFSCSIVAELIENYNSFLKQPLTKEMFVNSKNKPLSCYSDSRYGIHKSYELALKWYNEAEKKVIFKGFIKEVDDDGEIQIIGVIQTGKRLGTVTLYFSEQKNIYFNFCGDNKVIRTLGQLFEATNGELELKNVTI